MKKRILSLLTVVCLAASLLTVPAGAKTTSPGFTDISDRTTAVAAECMRLLGAMTGYENGAFRPEGQVTRAQFCKMATYVIKDGESQLSRYRTVTVFPDVKPTHWAAAYINLASDAGRGTTGSDDKTDRSIIKGYVDGLFHPERVVTVGQAVTILMRLLDYADTDVGGVWPDGYMAAADSAGLTDGVDAQPSAPLTRGLAARLLVNLLRCDTKNGANYGQSIAASYVEGMLTSSTAEAADGSDTAMQLGSTTVYSLADGKISTGAMNGMKGTLLLNRAGKVMTFVPEITSVSRTVTFASGTTTKLTTTSGETFNIKSDTAMVVNGEQKTWSTGYTWLNAGVSLTLYIGASGTVEYIFAGAADKSNAAVVVYTRGSAAGFSELAGGTTRYTIYKNGLPAAAGDLRPYDVASYSAATNTIRVCDTRLTGVYENASPNLDAPTEITVLGVKFPVLPTAADTMSRLKLGQTITLLLTEDNQVAGAIEAGSVSGINGNAVGIVESVSTYSATVRLLCGLTISGSVSLNETEASRLENRLAVVGSGKKGELSVSRLSGGVSGDLNVAERRLGSQVLTDNVMIYQTMSGGVKSISLKELESESIPSSAILCARTNWAGKIDLILLSDALGSDLIFGRTHYTSDNNDGTLLEVVTPQRTYSSNIAGGMEDGIFVGVKLDRNGNVESTIALSCFTGVSNSAWSSAASVTIAGRTYHVPSDVLCYNASSKDWVTLDEARAFAGTSTVYADELGYVRAVEVR